MTILQGIATLTTPVEPELKSASKFDAESSYAAIWAAHERTGDGLSTESSDASLPCTELATPLSRMGGGAFGRCAPRTASSPL
jgi:hypothetical protein